MTVGTLIEQLSRYPSDTPVVWANDGMACEADIIVWKRNSKGVLMVYLCNISPAGGIEEDFVHPFLDAFKETND